MIQNQVRHMENGMEAGVISFTVSKAGSFITFISGTLLGQQCREDYQHVHRHELAS